MRTIYVNVVATVDRAQLVLHLTGELDIATIETYRAELADVLDRQQRQEAASASGGQRLGSVVIDLGEMSFLSVRGLAMLSDLAGILACRNVGTVLAVQPDSLIARLVCWAGLDRQAMICDAPFVALPIPTPRRNRLLPASLRVARNAQRPARPSPTTVAATPAPTPCDGSTRECAVSVPRSPSPQGTVSTR